MKTSILGNSPLLTLVASMRKRTGRFPVREGTNASFAHFYPAGIHRNPSESSNHHTMRHKNQLTSQCNGQHDSWKAGHVICVELIMYLYDSLRIYVLLALKYPPGNLHSTCMLAGSVGGKGRTCMGGHAEITGMA